MILSAYTASARPAGAGPGHLRRKSPRGNQIRQGVACTRRASSRIRRRHFVFREIIVVTLTMLVVAVGPSSADDNDSPLAAAPLRGKLLTSRKCVVCFLMQKRPVSRRRPLFHRCKLMIVRPERSRRFSRTEARKRQAPRFSKPREQRTHLLYLSPATGWLDIERTARAGAFQCGS
jgi:hypothetical protein